MKWPFKIPLLGWLLCLMLHERHHTANNVSDWYEVWCSKCERLR